MVNLCVLYSIEHVVVVYPFWYINGELYIVNHGILFFVGVRSTSYSEIIVFRFCFDCRVLRPNKGAIKLIIHSPPSTLRWLYVSQLKTANFFLYGMSFFFVTNGIPIETHVLSCYGMLWYLHIHIYINFSMSLFFLHHEVTVSTYSAQWRNLYAGRSL